MRFQLVRIDIKPCVLVILRSPDACMVEPIKLRKVVFVLVFRPTRVVLRPYNLDLPGLQPETCAPQTDKLFYVDTVHLAGLLRALALFTAACVRAFFSTD